jgi:hypothetical protein
MSRCAGSRLCYHPFASSVSQVVYRSRVRLERVKGPLRKAWLPAEREPVTFGVHGAVAEHYKVPAKALEPHATTLDYIVAATAG